MTQFDAGLIGAAAGLLLPGSTVVGFCYLIDCLSPGEKDGARNRIRRGWHRLRA